MIHQPDIEMDQDQLESPREGCDEWRQNGAGRQNYHREERESAHNIQKLYGDFEIPDQ